MNLNETPRGTILYLFATGETVRLLGHSRGCCLIETESGEHFSIKESNACSVPCFKITDPERESGFSRNAALGHALRSAEFAAQRRMDLSVPSVEGEDLSFTLEGIQNHLAQRIDRLESDQTRHFPGREIAKAFLQELKTSHVAAGIFLGHQVVSKSNDTLEIDGLSYPKQEGIERLSRMSLWNGTQSLDDLLVQAKPQRDNRRIHPRNQNMEQLR